MTPDQTAAMLRRFRANWTHFEPTEDVMALWADEIENISAAVAKEAMQRIIERDERVPSIARFLAECQAVTRGQAIAAPRKEPDPPRPPKEDIRPAIAHARAVLAATPAWSPPADHIPRKVVPDVT
jgi:hypothetical protein